MQIKNERQVNQTNTRELPHVILLLYNSLGALKEKESAYIHTRQSTSMVIKHTEESQVDASLW